MKAEMHMDAKSDKTYAKNEIYERKYNKKKFMGDEILWQIQP